MHGYGYDLYHGIGHNSIHSYNDTNTQTGPRIFQLVFYKWSRYDTYVSWLCYFGAWGFDIKFKKNFCTIEVLRRLSDWNRKPSTIEINLF